CSGMRRRPASSSTSWTSIGERRPDATAAAVLRRHRHRLRPLLARHARGRAARGLALQGLPRPDPVGLELVGPAARPPDLRHRLPVARAPCARPTGLDRLGAGLADAHLLLGPPGDRVLDAASRLRPRVVAPEPLPAALPLGVSAAAGAELHPPARPVTL